MNNGTAPRPSPERLRVVRDRRMCADASGGASRRVSRQRKAPLGQFKSGFDAFCDYALLGRFLPETKLAERKCSAAFVHLQLLTVSGPDEGEGQARGVPWRCQANPLISLMQSRAKIKAAGAGLIPAAPNYHEYRRRPCGSVAAVRALAPRDGGHHKFHEPLRGTASGTKRRKCFEHRVAPGDTCVGSARLKFHPAENIADALEAVAAHLGLRIPIARPELAGRALRSVKAHDALPLSRKHNARGAFHDDGNLTAKDGNVAR